MPAQSKAQQRFMGMVHAAQQGEEPASPEVAKVAKDMKKSDAKDFASTKHKGLPNHVKTEILKRLKEYALMLPGHNVKPSAPAQSLEDSEGVNESVKVIKTGERTINKKVLGKVKELFPNAKKLDRKHIPQIGYVYIVKDLSGKILGKTFIDKGEAVIYID